MIPGHWMASLIIACDPCLIRTEIRCTLLCAAVADIGTDNRTETGVFPHKFMNYDQFSASFSHKDAELSSSCRKECFGETLWTKCL